MSLAEAFEIRNKLQDAQEALPREARSSVTEDLHNLLAASW
jgi:hypothetical protein